MIGNCSLATLSNFLKEGITIPLVVTIIMIETAIIYVKRILVSSIIHPPNNGERGMKINDMKEKYSTYRVVSWR